ncbi:MAG: response regulator, partial [Pseudomonadales bacterium]|nr:response regulator [Pseudomonadales bacterium]
RQIILNLVSNANDACRGEGEILIALTTESALEGDQPQPAMAVLMIRDSGEGMPEDTLEHIFEPFFTTRFTGRGLGLSTVFGIVQAHGGHIRVDSAPGDGTCFEVRLPMTETAEPLAGPDQEDDRFGDDYISEPVRAPVPAPHAGIRRLLVLDDEPEMTHLISNMLSGWPVVCEIAGNRRQASSLLSLNPDRFDRILIDYSLGGTTTEQFITDLRARQPDIKLIIMSGHHREELSKLLEASGNAVFLAKPFTIRELVTALNQ